MPTSDFPNASDDDAMHGDFSDDPDRVVVTGTNAAGDRVAVEIYVALASATDDGHVINGSVRNTDPSDHLAGLPAFDEGTRVTVRTDGDSHLAAMNHDDAPNALTRLSVSTQREFGEAEQGRAEAAHERRLDRKRERHLGAGGSPTRPTRR